MRLTALGLLTALALPAAGQTQSDNSFRWTGKVPAGRWLTIKNLNGDVTVGAASGDNVEVTATKRWRRGDPNEVHFLTEPDRASGDVTICAVWGDYAECDQRRDGRNHGTRNNDTSVEFKVLLPKGVKIAGSTVNGNLDIQGATDEVRATNVNGELEAATSGGPVNASNVNGSVRVRMGRIDDRDMEFKTINGSVIVDFPSDLNGDVSVETMNGSLDTNFEMTVNGRFNPKHIRAHIGKPGGPRIRMSTINGNVELRKR